MKVDWVYDKKYRVTFNRSYEWIDLINPCTVVVPQASGIAVALIEAEVFKWILAFNNTHGVDEGIYEDGAFVMRKFYLFTATSYALAVYLCLQEPDAFQPIEMAFDLNTHELKSRAQIKRKDSSARNRSSDNDVAIVQLQSRLANVKDQGRGIIGYMMDTAKVHNSNSIIQINWTVDHARHLSDKASIERNFGDLKNDITGKQGELSALQTARAHSPTAAVDHLGEILTVFLNSNQHIDVLSDHPEYIDPSWFICIDGIRGHNTSLTSDFNSCASIVYSAKGKQEVANKVDVMDELHCRLNLIGHEAF